MQPILLNHENYAKKAIEYAESSLYQFVSTKRAVRKRNFKNMMVSLGCTPLDGSNVEVAPIITTYTSNRDKIKRDKYLKVVKKLLDYESKEMMKRDTIKESDKVVKLFYEEVNHKLWKVMYRQIKGVDFGRDRLEVMT